MHTASLRKVGGSVMLAVPTALLGPLRLRAGARVGLAIERGTLVVRPEKRPRYTLDQLLIQQGPRARRSRRDRLWVEGLAAGRELI